MSVSNISYQDALLEKETHNQSRIDHTCNANALIRRPLAIDLFCGLFGWSSGLIAEGWRTIGVDIEDMRGQFGFEPLDHAELLIQDVITLHGSRFKDAALIVASPPCQEYSYMAMPWSRAKAKAAAIRADATGAELERLNRLFNACFRIQREASAAAGRRIPMVVENVKGAQPWVGRARWSFGSFYLWGDVPALMPPVHKEVKGYPRANKPHAIKNEGGSWFAVAHNTTSGHGQNPDGRKVAGFRFDGSGKSFQSASVEGVKQRGSGAAWFDKALDERRKNPDGIKGGGDWFGSGDGCSLQRLAGSRSSKRKFASAMIAKIPEPLSRHIARTFKREP